MKPVKPGNQTVRISKAFFFLSSLFLISILPLFPTITAQNAITIQGLVTDELNKPVADARVTLTGAGFTQSVLSQADGKFTLAAPRVGTYTVMMRADGYRPATQQVALTKPEETQVLLPAKQLLPTSLHVTLLDYQSSAPLSGGIVTVRGAEDETVRRAIDVSRGDYYFGRLASGVYELVVSVAGYETVTERVVVNSSGMADRLIVLVRVSTIPLGEKQRDRSFVAPKLPSNQVFGLYCDEDSSMWLATARGVCRYNGQNFESSERLGSPYAALDSLSVYDVLRDRDRTLWFATERGVFIQTEPRKRLERAAPGTELASLTVTHLCRGYDGSIWMATPRGAIQYEGNTPIFWNEARGFTNEPVNRFLVPRRNRVILAGTNAGLFRFNGAWEAVPLKKTTGEPLGGVLGLAEAEDGGLWAATTSGLYRVKDDGVERIDASALNQKLTDCLVDSFGNVWCARSSGGAVVYDPIRRETAELLPSDRVLTIAADREGQLWFGTEAGAVRHDVFSFVTFDASRGLTAGNVRTLALDTQTGRLWLGTTQGVQEFDGVRFQALKDLPEELEIRKLIAAPDGILWIASSKGLFRWNGIELNRPDPQALPSPDLRGLVLDAKRPLLWVATVGAVVPLNPTTLKPETEAVRIDGEVRFITQGSSGLLWIATDRGVYRYDPTTAELIVIGTAQGLKSLDVRWIQEQPVPGAFWFATGRGIESFDGARVQFSALSAATETVNVRCLFTDRDGFLWVGLGDGGVRKFLPQTNGFEQTYKRETFDLAGNQIRDIIQDARGQLWFAGETGLTRHVPNRAAPPVEIEVEVDGAEIDQPSPVEIGAGNHRIKFKFTGISMTGKVGYQHRLNFSGKEGEWKLLDPERTGKTEVQVSDLAAGEHVFEIRAVNRDLYGWNAPATRFVVRIDRPVYAKGWFWLVGSTLLAGSGSGFWLARRHKRREYVLPPHLQTFQPIDQNPYIVGNPIRQPRMFFGREDDIQYVRKKLEGTPQGLVIVLCGERRAGKSSILYQIQNGRLGPRFVPVFIDMQEMIVAGDGELFQRMARLVADSVNRRLADRPPSESGGDPGLPLIDAKRYAFTQIGNNPFDLFREFIDEVLRVIGDRRLVLLVDEYELLETKVENGKLNKEIFAFLAGLIDSHDRLSMLFTGSKKLEQRDRRYWREMLRRSLFRKIGHLSARDTERLIVEPVRDRVVHGRDVIKTIHRLTAGQPFYTQVICQNIVDYLNEHKRNFILRSDLQHIVSEITDNPLPQMIYFWEGLGDDEKLVLSLLAETISDENGYATASKLDRVILKNGYPVTLSENTIRLTLEEQYRNEFLLKEDDEHFAFRIDLMRHWIKHSHSIWQVVREVKTL